jgi:hypothetical protein
LQVDAALHREFLTLHDTMCGTSLVAEAFRTPPPDSQPDVSAALQACLAFIEKREGQRPDSAIPGDMSTAAYGRDAMAFVLRMNLPLTRSTDTRRSITCYGRFEDSTIRISDFTSP